MKGKMQQTAQSCGNQIDIQNDHSHPFVCEEYDKIIWSEEKEIACTERK